MKRYFSILLFGLLTLSAAAQEKAPAFPGAEGHGRYVTGGRGGNVVHVTNLNDSGTGSFRAAVSGTAKKIVVFDVGGVIALKSELKIGANTTILGQTAPYPGITLRYFTVRPDANNVIMRFIRCRRGQEKNVNDGADAIWTRERTGMIIDHCSFSWSIDEVASFYDMNNFTLQWCTVAESLNNAGHSKSAHGYGGIWGGKLTSFHHILLAHVSNRAPRFNGARYNWTGYKNNLDYETYAWKNAVQAENVDFRNCVMYNWGNGNGCYGGPGGGQINIVNNYYKAGPATTNKYRVTQMSVGNSSNSSSPSTYWGMASRYFIEGNYVDGKGENYDWQGVSVDAGAKYYEGEWYSLDTNNYYGDAVSHVIVDGVSCVAMKMTMAAPTGEITTHSAEEAFNKVLAYAGASFYRDDVDVRYVQEATEGITLYSGSKTRQGGMIDVVSDVEGYTEVDFPKGERPEGFDTDNDGMPDVWETCNGLNPSDPADAILYTLDAKGFYTNIEVYANSLVEDIVKAQNADALNAVEEYYPEAVRSSDIDYSGGAVERVDVSALPSPTLSDKKIVAEKCYSLGGQQMKHSKGRGLCVRQTIFSDGSSKSRLVGCF